MLRVRGMPGDDIYQPSFLEQLDEVTGKWHVTSVMTPLWKEDFFRDRQPPKEAT